MHYEYQTKGTCSSRILFDLEDGKLKNVEYIGHAVGGVCPFAVKDGVKVYLDESLKRFETVFPAAGSANSAIELTIPELEKYSKFDGWVDVCKDWRTDAEG